MAETLGSLIDKLTIKEIRLWHAQNENQAPAEVTSGIKGQLLDLEKEIDQFIKAALKGKVRIRDQKFKLYKNPKKNTPVEKIKTIGPLASMLAKENLDLWHFEDEIRKEGQPPENVALLKRKIDATNQVRNDLIDKIDEILENVCKKK
ncbi:MAG: DUF4254 domain-containing protein [Candidatus Saganbacteria bacterium]|nr:DUF4254 domain-containing protein [Candidatus Saganbacteria bacterium]